MSLVTSHVDVVNTCGLQHVDSRPACVKSAECVSTGPVSSIAIREKAVNDVAIGRLLDSYGYGCHGRVRIDRSGIDGMSRAHGGRSEGLLIVASSGRQDDGDNCAFHDPDHGAEFVTLQRTNACGVRA